MINLKSLFVVSLLLALLLPINASAEKQGHLSVAINTAGMQRMLSQRIAKAYLFLGMGIRSDKVRLQLEDSLKLFKRNHTYLKTSISDPEVLDMLAFLELMLDEYADIVSRPYTKEMGAEALDLSETILEGSDAIVKKLESMSKFKEEKIVNLSGRQRMLSQRIAKYYIAYQAGFHDEYTAAQLKKAVAEFESAHKILAQSEQSTQQISKMLSRIDMLWKLVRKFFLDVEKGGLPVSVLTTTDHILKSMNKVTLAYVNAQSKSL